MKDINDFVDLLSDVSSSDIYSSEQSEVTSFRFTDSQGYDRIGGEYEILGAPLTALGPATSVAPIQTVQPSISSFLDVESSTGIQLTLGDIAQPYIFVNGDNGAAGSATFAAPFDAVVAIADANGRFCTGTLIAENVVLTARHCSVNNSDQVVFGDNLNNPTLTVDVESVFLPGGNQEGGVWFDGDDIALLTLSDDVPSSVAQPLPLTIENDSLVGDVVSIFGYGDNGVGVTLADIDSGVDPFDTSFNGSRWGGQNVVDLYGDFGGGENLFLADFDDGTEFGNTLGLSIGSDSSPVNSEAIIADGDSGSPLLALVDGQLAIAGVASGGITGAAHGAVGFWTGVGRFAQPIANAGGQFVEGIGSDNGEDEAGGSNFTLPENDDHGDETGISATELEFVSNDGRLTARDSGFIGFEASPVESDVFRFTTTITGRIILDARATSGDLDAEIRIFDAQGNLIGSNDNAEQPATDNPLDSQLLLRNTPAGDYFVAVSANDGSNGEYRVAVRSRPGNLNVEPGDSFNSAGRIFLGTGPTTFVRSEIETRVDEDFFQFTAVETGRIVVRVNGLMPGLNTVLRGFDDDGLLLDSNNNFKGSLDPRVSFNVVEGDNYFLKLNSIGTTTGDYRLSLRMADTVGNVAGGTPFSLRLNDATDLTASNLGEAGLVDQSLIQSEATGLLAAV